MADSQAKACTVRWRRLDDDGVPLYVNGRYGRLAAISLMIKREVLPDLGYFDSVRVAADSEYLGRIEALLGADALFKSSHIAYNGWLRADSLTTATGSGMTWQQKGRHITRSCCSG